VYFYTPQEAFAKAADINDKTIKVGGMVKAGTVVWKPEDLALDFVMTDMQGVDIEVSHKGTPPDMFKENAGVVVEGRIEADGKKMVSQRLMVKHSEEYKTPDSHHSVDKELLEKSIFKN
jgi:cytochrome c-type biogenesis protein CcmE